MATAAWVILICCLIVVSSGVVLIAVAVSRALTNNVLILDSAHERWVKHTERMTDALIAKSPDQFVEMRLLQEEEEGGFFPPGSDDEDTQVGWGSLSDVPRPDALEEKLLAEDFPDNKKGAA